MNNWDVSGDQKIKKSNQIISDSISFLWHWNIDSTKLCSYHFKKTSKRKLYAFKLWTEKNVVSKWTQNFNDELEIERKGEKGRKIRKKVEKNEHQMNTERERTIPQVK